MGDNTTTESLAGIAFLKFYLQCFSFKNLQQMLYSITWNLRPALPVYFEMNDAYNK